MKYFLTSVAVVSLSAGGFWTIGVIAEPEGRLSILEVLLAVGPPLLGVGSLALVSRFEGWGVPLALKWPVDRWSLVRATWLAFLASYAVLVPTFWIWSSLVLRTWPDPSDHEGGLFVVLAALWMPLWWAGLPAAMTVWAISRRRHKAQLGGAV